MAVVALEGVCAEAALVAQARGRKGFALGSRGRLALARHDLERDLHAALLVACEPD
jgi:hypothetical protein